MSDRVDIVVVGAGIVGLATARGLRERLPEASLVVVDKEAEVAQHQSSHNSGVLHAGVYYTPGSDRARLCRTGKALLEDFADRHGIPRTCTGKVVVAVDPEEFERFEALRDRAVANRVPGLRELDRDELAELEPSVAGLRALHSPGTGSIDFAEVCRVLADLLRERAVDLRLGVEVLGMEERPSDVVVTTSAGELSAGTVVTCAGLQSDRVAGMTGGSPEPAIVPFRGAWYVLRPEAAGLVRGHVYPVPDPRLPFLGVHLSPRVDGEVWVGPNAVLAAGREAYDGRPALGDLRDVAGTAGFWRLARRFWRTGARELARDRMRAAYVREVQRYVPALAVEDLEERRPVGIRAQAVGADGALVDDFVIEESPRVVHVRNAPSPAATAALAIGGELADLVVARR